MSVTQLRSEIFDVIEATKVNRQITDIMLHGEVVAELRPKTVVKVDWDQYEKKLAKAVAHLRKVGWEEDKNFRKNFKLKQW